jgi:hypothetical protein
MYRSCFGVYAEVFFPSVLTRVKKMDFAAGYIIISREVIRFMNVTGATGQSEVGFVISAPGGERNYVFDFKGEIENSFGRVTVFAFVRGPLRDGRILLVH